MAAAVSVSVVVVFRSRLLLTSHLHLLFFLILLLLLQFYFPVSHSRPDKEALLDFKDSLENTAALDSTWMKTTAPCDGNKHWLGVSCHEDKVHGLNLMGLGLSGDIDIDYLSELNDLRGIQIANNSFAGPIPAFNKLGALKSLFLHDNRFSGEISPDYFSSMGSLKKLWLSGNRFTGNIPVSLGKLNYLIEVHLERNEFSGPVPILAQSSLRTVDLSDNRLEGEIPQDMSRFGIKSFEGNPGLCGTVVEKSCKANKNKEPNSNDDDDETPEESTSHESNNNHNDNNNSGTATRYVIVGVVVAILLATLLFKAKRKEDSFSVFEKENLDEVVQTGRIGSSTNHRRTSSGCSRRKGGDGDSVRSSSKKSSQQGKSMGDLVLLNDEKGVFGLPDLMKAAAEILGNGNLGSAYKAVMSNGLSVVVKRLRDMNKLNKDGFDTEIRRLGRLKHPNILPPLAYSYRKEEKLLVSEYIPKGSLLYLLHGDRGISHAHLNWPTRLKIIQGVTRGMGFLHSEFSSSDLPHGNLKSSNILLTSKYEPLLTDYAFYSFISNPQIVQALVAYRSPEAILYQQVNPKSDVFCLGIVILELLTGKFPSQYLHNQKGGTDVVQWVRSMISEKRELELIDPEIAASGAGVTDSAAQIQMQKLLHVAASCTQSDMESRLNMKEAIGKIEEICSNLKE